LFGSPAQPAQDSAGLFYRLLLIAYQTVAGIASSPFLPRHGEVERNKTEDEWCRQGKKLGMVFSPVIGGWNAWLVLLGHLVPEVHHQVVAQDALLGFVALAVSPKSDLSWERRVRARG
jgi:hypothetical protein